jgi:hypothetical protein
MPVNTEGKSHPRQEIIGKSSPDMNYGSLSRAGIFIGSAREQGKEYKKVIRYP